MQFIIFSILTLVALVAASPIAAPDQVDARSDDSIPSMSTANGDVVDFNSTGVYLASATSGQKK